VNLTTTYSVNRKGPVGINLGGPVTHSLIGAWKGSMEGPEQLGERLIRGRPSLWGKDVWAEIVRPLPLPGRTL
jgi:hypothetical protein